MVLLSSDTVIIPGGTLPLQDTNFHFASPWYNMAAPIVVSAAPCDKYSNEPTWLLTRAASALISDLVCASTKLPDDHLTNIFQDGGRDPGSRDSPEYHSHGRQHPTAFHADPPVSRLYRRQDTEHKSIMAVLQLPVSLPIGCHLPVLPHPGPRFKNQPEGKEGNKIYNPHRQSGCGEECSIRGVFSVSLFPTAGGHPCPSTPF